MQGHLRERQVILRRTIKPTTAHMELRLLWQLHRSRLQRAVVAPLMDWCQAGAHRRRNLEGGVVHAERLANVLRKIAIEPLPTDHLDDLAEPIDVDAIFPALARIAHQRSHQHGILTGDDPWNRGICLVLLLQGAPDVVGEAGRMSQQVTDCYWPS